MCLDDIDIYWDNVGGELADAAIERIASGGRVVICGQIAQYNATSPPQRLSIISHIQLSRQAREDFTSINNIAFALHLLRGWALRASSLH